MERPWTGSYFIVVLTYRNRHPSSLTFTLIVNVESPNHQSAKGMSSDCEGYIHDRNCIHSYVVAKDWWGPIRLVKYSTIESSSVCVLGKPNTINMDTKSSNINPTTLCFANKTIPNSVVYCWTTLGGRECPISVKGNWCNFNVYYPQQYFFLNLAERGC